MWVYKYNLQEEAGEQGGGTGDVTITESMRLAAPEGTYKDEPVQTPTEADKVDPADTEVAKSTTQTDDTFTPNPIWDAFKSDEGFVMPEVTKETEQDLLKVQVAKKFGFDNQPTLHPLAKQIQEMSVNNPNLTINDLVDTVSSDYVDLKKMTTDQKIAFDFRARYGTYDETTNPDGLTEDDINEEISKLSKIGKQELALEIQSRVDAYNKKLMDDFNNQKSAQYEENYTKTLADNEKWIADIKTKVTNVDTIFGIPVSQEDHAIWLDELKTLITPDKTTGIRGIDIMLSDDVMLYKAAFLLAKSGEDKMVELITKGRESTKEDIFKKLKLTPSFGGSRRIESLTMDAEQERMLLSQPDRGSKK